MSGGVDSSVAAALLVKDGFDVTGAYMVNYDDPSAQQSCWKGDYQDALRVAAKLGIKLLRLDFQKEYKKHVLDYLYKEYEAGRTPNPDILCNKFVKFGSWLEKAKELGFDFIATGHYAKVGVTHPAVIPGHDQESIAQLPIKLLCAKDTNKDQTYFLHQLNQDQLKHVMFPIGDYTKDEVRKLAKKFDLPTADKEESMGICFIGEIPMKEFLQKKIKVKKGNIILSSHTQSNFSPLLKGGDERGGQIVGTHDGLAFYTIGQRLGIDSKPLFVIKKNLDNNELIVGAEDDPGMYASEAQISETNWISGSAPELPLKCQVRLRHRQSLQDCHCEEVEGRRGNLIIKFITPQRAVTPGQFAVFYSKGECLGGGVIL